MDVGSDKGDEEEEEKHVDGSGEGVEESAGGKGYGKTQVGVLDEDVEGCVAEGADQEHGGEEENGGVSEE